MKQGLQLSAQVCPSICLNRLFATLRTSFNSSYSVVVAHSCIRNGKAGVQFGYGLLIGLEHGHTTLGSEPGILASPYCVRARIKLSKTSIPAGFMVSEAVGTRQPACVVA